MNIQGCWQKTYRKNFHVTFLNEIRKAGMSRDSVNTRKPGYIFWRKFFTKTPLHENMNVYERCEGNFDVGKVFENTKPPRGD